MAKSFTFNTLLRVPDLFGYIKHPITNYIIGFLREWIPGDSLRKAHTPDTPENRRQMWASQISTSVHQLHEIGVTWGDGKASNVVIDKEDIAWLIDFGGGYSRGWVDDDLAGTVEGDEQVLKNMASFLNVEYQSAPEIG